MAVCGREYLQGCRGWCCLEWCRISAPVLPRGFGCGDSRKRYFVMGSSKRKEAEPGLVLRYQAKSGLEERWTVLARKRSGCVTARDALAEERHCTEARQTGQEQESERVASLGNPVVLQDEFGLSAAAIEEPDIDVLL